MGISIWQLLIVLVIIILLFGTKKLKNIGSDLGGAFKGFKKEMDGEAKKAAEDKEATGRIIEGEASEQTTTTQEKEKSE